MDRQVNSRAMTEDFFFRCTYRECVMMWWWKSAQKLAIIAWMFTSLCVVTNEHYISVGSQHNFLTVLQQISRNPDKWLGSLFHIVKNTKLINEVLIAVGTIHTFCMVIKENDGLCVQKQSSINITFVRCEQCSAF